LPRARLDQRLLTASARSWAVALADPSFSFRDGRRSHLRENSSSDRQSPGPPRVLSRARIRESELCVATHADERPDRARVHHLSPRPFYRAGDGPPLRITQGRPARPLRRLLNDGLWIRKALRLGVLCRWPVAAPAS